MLKWLCRRKYFKLNTETSLSKVFAYGKKQLQERAKIPCWGRVKSKICLISKSMKTVYLSELELFILIVWVICTDVSEILLDWVGYECKIIQFLLVWWPKQRKAKLAHWWFNLVKHVVKKCLKCVQCSWFKLLVQFLMNKIHYILTVNKKTNTVKPLVCG